MNKTIEILAIVLIASLLVSVGFVIKTIHPKAENIQTSRVQYKPDIGDKTIIIDDILYRLDEQEFNRTNSKIYRNGSCYYIPSCPGCDVTCD